METLEEKRAQAIEYLRSRGKYVLDEGCTFKPTPYTDQFSIVERYGGRLPSLRNPDRVAEF